MISAKIGKKREPMTFYVCDRKRCKNCSPECRHTKDLEHALYKKHFEFEYHGRYEDERALFEVIRH